MASTTAHHVNVSVEDIEQAILTIARQRLMEQSPGLQLDTADWYRRAKVFMPPGMTAVAVVLESSKPEGQ